MLDSSQPTHGGLHHSIALRCSTWASTQCLYLVQAVLEQTNQSIFQALLHFAATAHQTPDISNTFAQRRRIIPAALTFAGGVNSADHAQTFPTLVHLLRQQVCILAVGVVIQLYDSTVMTLL